MKSPQSPRGTVRGGGRKLSQHLSTVHSLAPSVPCEVGSQQVNLGSVYGESSSQNK